MAASYPAAAKSFTPVVDGNTVASAFWNDGYDEITAVEQALVSSGLAHNVVPDATANNRDLGSTAKKWRALYLSGNATIDGTATITGGIVGLLSPLVICEGRLTLTSGTPVTTGDVSGATSAYFAPYKGNRIALYDGSSAWNVRTFSEITISLAGLTASTLYDIFAYDNAGTVTIELLAWTNTTTRATALTTQDGVLVKSGATTRRYLGTVYINSTGGQTDDTYTKRYVWNYYNRVPLLMRRIETNTSWTYTTNTYRQALNSTANQVECVIGVAEVPLEARVQSLMNNTNANVAATVAIGLDSTTTPATGCLISPGTSNVANLSQPTAAHLRTYPAVGYHTVVWLEKSQVSGTTTFVGTNGDATLYQSGIDATVWG